MLTQMAQILTHASFMGDWLRFKTNLGNLSEIQSDIMTKILSTHPYLKGHEEFLKEPINDFASLQLKLPPPRPGVRLQPTSGSGEKEKLIPYTKEFINELNSALNPWLFDLCKTYPEVLLGKHYWSLSWLPTHWRQKGWRLDDFELLPPWKKTLTKALLAVPHEVSQAPTLSSSQFATLAWLTSCRELSFISVWSPTFFLELIKLLEVWKAPLIKTLETGLWGLFEEDLKHLTAPQNAAQAKVLKNSGLTELWPHLKLMSSWDSSSSKGWAQTLKDLFPNTQFQGKGLWATEGVISIPFEGKFTLSYLSHYYEFFDLDKKNILRADELQTGMQVHPLLTTSNGFTRYRIKDRLLVTGFNQSVPTLEFLERDNTFDMVGEKLDTHTLLQIHDELKKQLPHLAWVNAFALNGQTSSPYYCFVFEGEGSISHAAKVIKGILNQHFHYHLAQELGQLGHEKILVMQDAFHRYEKYQLERGMVQGNIKVELGTKVELASDQRIFSSCFNF
jgi:hypothetical protein